MTSDAAFAVSAPLVHALGALGVLRRGSDRALVLPTPTMLWMVFISEHDTTAPWYAQVAAYAAVLVLLVACWQQQRALARGAVIASALAAAWLALSHS